MISAAKREDIIGALRRGTVPGSGLDAFAVGVDAFAPVIDEELERVAAGRGAFKAVRGEYGSGKTFFGRWFQERARSRGFAASEVQINETETPLHKLETVYRRLVERLGTADAANGAFRSVIDGWFFALEQDVLAETFQRETGVAGQPVLHDLFAGDAHVQRGLQMHLELGCGIAQRG